MPLCIPPPLEDLFRYAAAGLSRWTPEQPSALNFAPVLVLTAHSLSAAAPRHPGFQVQLSGGPKLSHCMGRKERPTTSVQKPYYTGLVEPRAMVLQALLPSGNTCPLFSPRFEREAHD
jgi:hypothetical protein